MKIKIVNSLLLLHLASFSSCSGFSSSITSLKTARHAKVDFQPTPTEKIPRVEQVAPSELECLKVDSFYR